MHVAVVGTRDFNNYHLMSNILTNFIAPIEENIIIVSGGARGADSMAVTYAKIIGLDEPLVFPADWTRYGKAAGHMRNPDIVNAADVLFAFWDGKSTGTADSIELAKNKGIPTCVIYYEKEGAPCIWYRK